MDKYKNNFQFEKIYTWGESLGLRQKRVAEIGIGWMRNSNNDYVLNWILAADAVEKERQFLKRNEIVIVT